MNSPRDWLKKKIAMKVRIKGNSIRYRLTRSEVETFCKTGYFEETTSFGSTLFSYAVQAKEDIEVLEANFKDGSMTLLVNRQKSTDWFQTNQIGFRHQVQHNDGTVLHLLLEKDFACLDEREEDQSDNYPNPKAT